jgi:Fe-S-cluster-containing hydrogenase component 2
MRRTRSRTRSASRRQFLKTAGAGLGALVGAPGAAQAFDFEALLQRHFREISREDLDRVLQRLERKYTEKFGKPFRVEATDPVDGVLFGYGLDISRCIGCRRCVYGCIDENNQSRDPEIHYIRVLEFERESVIRYIDFEEGNPFYEREKVPAEGMVYLPVACQQCAQPECVRACPTTATWQEPDGIVVIDYDWCIGCRYCMAAPATSTGRSPSFPRTRPIRTRTTWGTAHACMASSRSARGASSGPDMGAIRPASRRVPSERASSGTCSIRTARSDTCSNTSGPSCSRPSSIRSRSSSTSMGE